MNREFAFTLAEVLVTLGIIGVVSAMTIPSLTQSWQKQAYVTQLKKVYSQLSQAASYTIQKEQVMSLDESKYSYNDANAPSNFLKDNFKIVQDCGHSYTPCFAARYRNINGDTMGLYRPEVAVTTADGYALAILENRYGHPGFSSTGGGDWHGEMIFEIDINGAKGPNVSGRDLFHLELYSDGTATEIYDIKNAHKEDLADPSYCKEDTQYGLGCLTSIINNGWTMDY